MLERDLGSRVLGCRDHACAHRCILGNHSWMWLQDRSYRTLAVCPVHNRVLGERTLSLPGVRSSTAFVPDFLAHPESSYLLYTDNDGIFLLVQNFTPPAPACPENPGGRAARHLVRKHT